MATDEYTLSDPPADPRTRELWLQHGAGFILFQDVRQYAIDEMPETHSEAEHAAALQAIDDAVYGLMMVLDGIPAGLRNDKYRLSLETKVKLETVDDGETVEELDLFEGDGMCMGYHGWKEGDYGKVPPAIRAEERSLIRHPFLDFRLAVNRLFRF
jgi:hypothetical protein